MYFCQFTVIQGQQNARVRSAHDGFEVHDTYSKLEPLFGSWRICENYFIIVKFGTRWQSTTTLTISSSVIVAGIVTSQFRGGQWCLHFSSWSCGSSGSFVAKSCLLTISKSRSTTVFRASAGLLHCQRRLLAAFSSSLACALVRAVRPLFVPLTWPVA